MSLSGSSPCVRTSSSDETSSLTGSAQSNLSVLIHFLLLFGRFMHLSSFDLLDDKPEQSLLLASGRVYYGMVKFFGTRLRRGTGVMEDWLREMDVEERLREMCDMANDMVDGMELRAAMSKQDGRVEGAARLRTNMRDGKGDGYVWLRGLDGCCSDRILWSGKEEEKVLRGEDTIEKVRQLEKGGRKDFVTAGWLKEKMDRAKARARRAREAEEERRKEMEKREMEKREMEKRERERREKEELDRKIDREQKYGRGKRAKRKVSYEEEDEESDPSDEEFVMMSQESQDADEEVVAIGRARVYTSGRTTRNSNKSVTENVRPVRKCRRVLST